MVARAPQERNYWHLLDAAREALDAGDFATAERRHDEAVARRERSPGRVFLTERLADGARRLLHRGSEPAPAGRWRERCGAFRADFLRQGEERVRAGVRLAELRPEDEAEANQPVLAAALHLVARSRLFREEPASAVVLLKGLVRTAHRTGRPFAVDLLRPDLPLTPEDRLWLARKGVAMLESFRDQGSLEPGTVAAREWSDAVLSLLQPEHFGQGARLEEERAWLEARTADRLLARASDSVERYAAYLHLQPSPGPRADEARVRLLELHANIDAAHFPVPRYEAALRALRTAGLAPGSEAAGRYRTAISCLEHRRPEPRADEGERAWATAGLEADGSVAVVFWWGAAPRDLATWRAGDPVAPLEEFLAPCGGRVLAADPATAGAVAGLWPGGPPAWSVQDYLEVLTDAGAGTDATPAAALAALAAGETGPWRADWRRDLGRPELAPRQDDDPSRPAAAALRAGLALRGRRARVAAADPALRAGIGELARRGDPASGVLHDLLVLADPAGAAMDAAFAPWTLPLLWTRPFPAADATAAPAAAPPDPGLRPDLARDALAVVTTGRPSAVIAAWCAGQHRWRVVLDRPDRLPALLPVAGTAGGPVTAVPPGGAVHDLAAALALLEDLLPGGRLAGDAGLLPLCHWRRLVGTHNGDLLDREMLQPRAPGVRPQLDRYQDLVSDLPRVAPGADADDEGWGAQFGQRVRRAGCVLGLARDLPADTAALDALWGVFEGSGASWIFLDAAVVREQLATRRAGGPEAWHERLHARGERHLALLTGAVWGRSDVEDLLAEEAAVYGPAAALALTDLRPPPLLLADRGRAADARRPRPEALAALVEHVVRAGEDGRRRLVLPPPTGLQATFWREEARRLPGGGDGWDVADGEPGAGRPDTVLCLPVLPGLEDEPAAPAAATPDAWRAADAVRRQAGRAARRRAAAALAARLAGRWARVELLDPRWWHLARPADAVAGRGWTGEKAAAALAPAGSRCFDLPDARGPGAGPDPRRVAAVATWLASRLPEGSTGETPDEAPVAFSGVRLVIGGDAGAAAGLLAAVVEAREAGDLDRWLLVAADEAWPPAAAAASASPVPGVSAWDPETPGAAPGPVLWVSPEGLARPELAALLAAHPPAGAVVPRLDTWLPGAGEGRRAKASSLRALLGAAPPAVLLRAERLSEGWSRFLVAAARVQGVAADGRADEAAEGPPDDRPPAPVLTARLRGLLQRLRPELERRAAAGDGQGPRHLVSARELVPLARLGQMTGVDPRSVRDGVHILRWAATLAGDPLSAADAEPDADPERRAPGHALLVRRRYAAVEAGLDELAAHLDLFLAAWLEDLPAGASTRLDLGAPPARVAPEALRRLDTFLLHVDPARGLAYEAPGGTLFSPQRRLRLGHPAAAARRAVLEDLQVFRRRLQEVMEAAVETADGFLVETGLVNLRPEERAFLALGAALEEWRWLGPPGADVLHVVDLLTLADSATARARGDVWSLVGDELGRPVPAAGAAARDRRGGWRALLPGGGRDHDARTDAVAAVADLAGDPQGPAFLVLRGLAGTGRLGAVLDGLGQARRRGGATDTVLVCCPDVATGARAARRAAAAGLHPDVRVVDAATPLPGQAEGPLAAAAARDVVVMLEAQRFAPEQRYRVAQAGRGRRLVMTVDPAATREPWENLFLTTPRARDVHGLEEPARRARRLWDELRGLAPEHLRPGAPARGEKGRVAAEYAANLDQCLARLGSAREEGLLPGCWRLTAPLREDLDHLGAALRARGWLAVDEEELDGLCLPGPCELLALAGAVPVPAEGDGPRPDPEQARELLVRLPGAGPEAADWLEQGTWDPGAVTLDELAEAAARADVLPALAWPAARARAAGLRRAWGGRSLAEVATSPLVAVWRHLLAGDVGLDPGDGGRPRVLLNPAERAPGAPVAAGVYLCLGSEEPRRHYQVLAGVEESLLVLYQERSPLPSGADDAG